MGYVLVTDTQTLLKETKVEPGEHYILEDYGDLGKNKQASLVCEYFKWPKCAENGLLVLSK